MPLKDKISMIESLRKGETCRKLSGMYGEDTSRSSDIKKNTMSISKYLCKLDSEHGSIQRKLMNKSKNELKKVALHCWFLQKRSTYIWSFAP